MLPSAPPYLCVPNETKLDGPATGVASIASNVTAASPAKTAAREAAVAPRTHVKCALYHMPSERLQQRVRELEVKQPESAADPPNGRRGWDGIHTRSAHASQTQWYGPSSAFYFMGRISSYLSTVLEQPQNDHHLQPNSASRTFTSPTSPKHGLEEPSSLGEEAYLSAIEEDFFLNLFWQSYHPIYQILDETEFREHYKSLWALSPTTRKSSALVDIILALCMQYGVSLSHEHDYSVANGDVGINDASIAGRWYYRRSQTLLTSDVESPSIVTLQCRIFSVVYLCNASFQNMAHVTLAMAMRTAHILGFHLEPPDSLPRAQRELRKRIWWTLYTVESKTCMKLGRPWLSADMTATCSVPADDHELARLSVSNIAAYGDNVTWLTYGRLLTTLVLTAERIYLGFYDKYSEIMEVNNVKSLYNTDLTSLETLAEWLQSQRDSLQTWLCNVPDAMKTKRKDSGEPFSTDRSALYLERYVPSWLQRQRLLLELLYHNLCMNIYRPFIYFPSSSPAAVNTVSHSTPMANGHAVSCINHAIAITHILHEALTSTDLLKGWYEAFQWQWNATPSMAGFVLAYPLHSLTPVAREALDMGITVFEAFGTHFAIAMSAANVTRGLAAKADFLNGRFQSGPTPSLSNQTKVLPARDGDDPGSLGLMDTPWAELQSMLAGEMGLAYNDDWLYGFEPLYAGSRDQAEPWSFTNG
ncbi:putative transcriptional regulatory protein C417,09c [Talaromyces islandicus]|uniref:Putative transcriptional regulatory protein C417,09c n=1 Tax=Talaromyces islandicus TaxID=28573 RepID=A0A0U1MBD2_TALIS|nr:putative transcriptional regulatory protein C417,09c [Talaromyces islandicus]